MRVLLKVACLGALFGLGGMASAPAQDASPDWVYGHPWRIQVRSRMAMQEFRIRQGLIHGDLTPAQAADLRAHIYAINMQEKALALFHNGHLTREEHAYLNQQANRNSAAIFRARHGI